MKQLLYRNINTKNFNTNIKDLDECFLVYYVNLKKKPF